MRDERGAAQRNANPAIYIAIGLSRDIAPSNGHLNYAHSTERNRHSAAEQQRTAHRENKCERAERRANAGNKNIRVKSDTFHHIFLI